MGERNIGISEQVPASRKLGADAARELLEGSERLVVAKGKKVRRFDKPSLASEEAVAAMLGPTGNLRAPTIRTGDTLLVGFNEELFDEVFAA